MSSLFNDPTFETMKNDEDQWLNLAIQPFECSIINAIAELPETIVVDETTVMDLLAPTTWDSQNITIRSDTILSNYIHNVELPQTSKRIFSDLLQRRNSTIYEISAEGDTVDFINNIFPTITLKKVGEITESEVIEKIAYTFSAKVSSLDNKQTTAARLNSLIDTFSPPKPSDNNYARKSSSVRQKRKYLTIRVRSLIKDNEWNLKNGDLMLDLCDWTIDYLMNENLRALSLITRLKCMVHKGEPIYSMETI
jgi:hypothetical protein